MKIKLDKNKASKYIAITIVLLLALVFIAKFGGPGILRLYIEVGMGNCQKAPFLCIRPESEIINPVINEDYLRGLLQYNLAEIQVRLPKGFSVIKEKIRKPYHKRGKDKYRGSIVYLLYENPDFFVTLFPQLKKHGIKNDYEFITRIMYSTTPKVKSIGDTFFVIMKGVFTPDLGEQKNVNMVKITVKDKRGYITYNLSPQGNYFDCDILNEQRDYFKIYIKDNSAILDLDKVIAIVSTIKRI